MRPTVSEVTDLGIHIEKRNLEKCQQRGATPYRIDGLTEEEVAEIARRTAERMAKDGHKADGASDRLILAKLGTECAALLPECCLTDARMRVGAAKSVAEVRRLMREAEGGTEEEADAGATGDALEAWPRGEGTAEEEAPAPAEPKPGAVAMIPVSELEEHPEALAFWPDSEQRREDIEAVCASVAACRGVRDPLAVCRKGGGGWWVIDGCTRLEGARRAGLEAVPCLVCDIPSSAVRDEVYLRNMSRTRFCTAMRVMRYLETNADAVIATAERNADPAKCGSMGGRGNKAISRETAFSSEAIAERLKVSKPDVVAGIELLRCRLGGMTVKVSEIRGGPRTLVKADEEEREAVEAAYRACLAGTPLRRWVPAAKGYAETADKAKKPTDYADLMERALTSLQTCFAHWDEMTEKHQEDAVRSWKKVVAKSPADVMAATRRLLPPL